MSSKSIALMLMAAVLIIIDFTRDAINYSSTGFDKHMLNTNYANQITTRPSEVILPLCSPLNLTASKEGIICLPKCKPFANQTIEGLGLDPDERINITARQNNDLIPGEYGKYRIHFPEEGIYLNHATKQMGDNDMLPRPVTERLFRRIIAKLFRAGVLDPSKNIINTGSWIGDNALPWAMMLEQLTENPGKVIAVDPSANYLQYMSTLANENSIGNICTHLTVYSAEERTIFTGSMEHMGVNLGKKRGLSIKAITLDSENIEDVALLHIDVEGHESELLQGAIGLIDTSRPVIVTEGVVGGRASNDRKVAEILILLGYIKSNEIPEVCGWNHRCRNHIWWPDNKTEAAAMAVVREELEHSVVPWIALDLPQ